MQSSDVQSKLTELNSEGITDQFSKATKDSTEIGSNFSVSDIEKKVGTKGSPDQIMKSVMG